MYPLRNIALLLTGALCLSAMASRALGPTVGSVEGPGIGSDAPEINGSEWFNVTGRAPSIAELRGRTLLIEFWATW